MMDTNKMREEFERTSVRDTRRQPPKGNNYIDPMAQMDWLAFQKGWLQSRETLVIDLPPVEVFGSGVDDFALSPEKVRKAIEAQGLKVKP